MKRKYLQQESSKKGWNIKRDMVWPTYYWPSRERLKRGSRWGRGDGVSCVPAVGIELPADSSYERPRSRRTRAAGVDGVLSETTCWRLRLNVKKGPMGREGGVGRHTHSPQAERNENALAAAHTNPWCFYFTICKTWLVAWQHSSWFKRPLKILSTRI